MTTEVEGNILRNPSENEALRGPHFLLNQVVYYTLFRRMSDESNYQLWFVDPQPVFQPPNWLAAVIRSLGTWEGLQGEWASDGAKPVAWGMSALALRVLSEHLPDEAPAPTVGATWDGGYELSWAGVGMFISILLDPAKGVSCSFNDSRSGIESRGEFAVDCLNNQLVNLLNAFTDSYKSAATPPRIIRRGL